MENRTIRKEWRQAPKSRGAGLALAALIGALPCSSPLWAMQLDVRGEFSGEIDGSSGWWEGTLDTDGKMVSGVVLLSDHGGGESFNAVGTVARDEKGGVWSRAALGRSCRHGVCKWPDQGR
jgi:hypothetical protein